MKITGIKLTPITNRGNLIAVASVITEEGLRLGHIGVHYSDKNGLQLTFESRFWNPLTGSNAYNFIEQAIVLRLQEDQVLSRYQDTDLTIRFEKCLTDSRLTGSLAALVSR